MILLSQLPECWDHRDVPSHPYFSILKLLFFPQIHTSRVHFHETQAVIPKVQREQEKPGAKRFPRRRGGVRLRRGLRSEDQILLLTLKLSPSHANT